MVLELANQYRQQGECMGLRSSTTTEPSLALMHFAGENGATVLRLTHMCREGMGEKGGGESFLEGRQVEKDSRRKKRRESGLGEEERAEWGGSTL